MNESIEDLVGEVTSAIEESIKDEVGESRMSTSHVVARQNNNSDKRSRERHEAKQADVLHEIEKVIDSERSAREEQLALDLKKRKISPRTYDRGIREIEKWVI